MNLRRFGDAALKEIVRDGLVGVTLQSGVDHRSRLTRLGSRSRRSAQATRIRAERRSGLTRGQDSACGLVQREDSECLSN